MQIQVNSDGNIDGREALVRHVEAEVAAALDRFNDRITRVEVHLSDENAGKPGESEKRCLMEARVAGSQPVAVSDQRASLEDAVSGAARKLQHLLESSLGRSSHRKGADSIRTDGIAE
jgi:ribosome-associated translation inhibitor RaiA